MLFLVYGKMSPPLENRSLWLNLSSVLSSLTNWVSSSDSVNLIIVLCTGTLSWSSSLFLEYVRHISCSVMWFGLKRAGLANIYHLKNCSYLIHIYIYIYIYTHIYKSQSRKALKHLYENKKLSRNIGLKCLFFANFF